MISINASPDCQGPITVLAGDEGVDVLNQLRRALTDPSPALARDGDNADLIDAFDGGRFRFEYTALTYPDLFANGAAYRGALEPLTPLRGDPALQEGATLIAYDTATVAMRCIRDAATQQALEPSATAVLNACRALTNQQRPVYGATGPISFGTNGVAVNRPVTVVQVDADGSAPQIAIYRN